MSVERKTVCLLIDRRSTLALVLLFLVTYSTEVALTIVGVAGTVTSCYILSTSTVSLEERIQVMQRTSKELQSEMAMTQQQIYFLQQTMRQRHLLRPAGPMIHSGDNDSSSESL